MENRKSLLLLQHQAIIFPACAGEGRKDFELVSAPGTLPIGRRYSHFFFRIQVGFFNEGISERNPVSTLECPSIPSLSLLVDSRARAAACQIAREPKFNNFGYLSLRPSVTRRPQLLPRAEKRI